MPLIRPNDNESKDGFVSRCMGDEKMLSEYPDQKQRTAVCNSLYSKEVPEEVIRAVFKSTKTYSWDAEIFAVGRWNGMSFTKDDLQDIVDNFYKLKHDGFRVPLKLGHNDKQPVFDGQPAMGWVKELKLTKGKYAEQVLLATFSEIPEVVHKVVEAKRYMNVSIELDFDVTYKGKRFKNVLTGTALLGADLPAVHTLAELQHYLERESNVPLDSMVFNGRHISFSVVRNDGTLNKEDIDMSDEVEQLKQKLAAAEALAEAEKQKREKFERDDQARLEREAKEKVTFNRKQATDYMNEAVEKMELTPAQRDTFTKVLRLEDDESVKTLDFNVVKSLVDSARVKRNGSPIGTSGGGEQHDDTGEELDSRVRKYQLDHGPKISYSIALEQVMRADMDLAKRHILASGETTSNSVEEG